MNAEPEPVRSVAGDQSLGDRIEQQDRFAISVARLSGGRTAPIYVVADGMGGHIGGATAAEAAVAAFIAAARDGSFPGWHDLLDKSLAAANRAIGTAVRASPNLKGMGCTLLAAIVEPGQVHYVSVGDSPFFRLGPCGLERVNADHSMAPLIDSAYASGEITHADALNHPQRSALRSALTGSTVSLIDLQTIDVLPDEWLLLASDGLTALDPPRIAQIVLEASPQGAAGIVGRLLRAVDLERIPEQDNCTVIAFQSVGVASAAPSAPDRALAGWVLTIVGIVTLAVVGSIAGVRMFGPPVGLGQGEDENRTAGPDPSAMADRHEPQSPQPRPGHTGHLQWSTEEPKSDSSVPRNFAPHVELGASVSAPSGAVDHASISSARDRATPAAAQKGRQAAPMPIGDSRRNMTKETAPSLPVSDGRQGADTEGPSAKGKSDGPRLEIDSENLIETLDPKSPGIVPNSE